MTDPTPVSRKDKVMRDPKKQAQESREVLAVWNELANVYNLVVNGRIIVEADRQGKVDGAVETEQHGKVVITLTKNGTSPSIIFDWCEPDDIEAWEEIVNNPRYNSMCRYMGFKWEHGERYYEERGEPKKILEITLMFFELKIRHKGDNLIMGTETFETSESKDFACVFLEVLNRVEELYTVPYWKTIEGGRRKWASMID